MGEKSKLFLVLCLHRSGSSATAGVMHHLGIHMGDRLGAAVPSNPKGHFENIPFWEMNQAILRSLGGSSSQPPDREAVRNSDFPENEIRSFLAAQSKPVWGLKDPVTVITFEIWRPYLEEIADITYVFVRRSFAASVRSLAYRDQLGLDRACQMLIPYLNNLIYYRQMLIREKEDILEVYFDDLVKNPESFVAECNRRIGQSPDHNLDRVKDFLDEKLKHF